MNRLQARQILNDLGLTLTGRFDGEQYMYRVDWIDGDGHEAFFTSSLLDAVDAGVAMAESLNEIEEAI